LDGLRTIRELLNLTQRSIDLTLIALIMLNNATM